MRRHLAIATLVLLAPALAHAQDAMELAKTLTREGAATFETRNARAMADYYMTDASIFLVFKNEQSGELKVDTREGHSAIEAAYAELFKDDKPIQAKNTVEFARFVAPEVLMITGTFEIVHEGKTLQLPFVQVRNKQGGGWKISSVRVFVTPEG